MYQRFKLISEELRKLNKVASDADFARILGISRGEMSNVLAGRRPVSRRIVDNLTTAFPEYSAGWLLTGEGEMLRTNTSTASGSSVSIAGEEIKENNIQVNTDASIAQLIAEVAAQRRVTEKVLEQKSELIAIIAGKKKEEDQ